MQLVYRSKLWAKWKQPRDQRAHCADDISPMLVRTVWQGSWWPPTKVETGCLRAVYMDEAEVKRWRDVFKDTTISENHPMASCSNHLLGPPRSKPQHSRDKERDQKCKYNRRFLVPHLTAGNPHITSASSNFIPWLLWKSPFLLPSFFDNPKKYIRNRQQINSTFDNSGIWLHYWIPIGTMLEHKRHHLLPSVPSFSSGDITPPSRVPTPLRQTPRSLRPYVYALMAFKHGRSFESKVSTHRARRLSQLASKEGPFAPALTVCSHLPS